MRPQLPNRQWKLETKQSNACGKQTTYSPRKTRECGTLLSVGGQRCCLLTAFVGIILLFPSPAWSQFKEPEPTGLVSDAPFGDWSPFISSDLLEAFFVSAVPGRRWNIWTARRDSVDDPWSNQQALDIISSQGIEGSPHLSPDGLTLTFESNGLDGGYGGFDLWQTTRASTQDPWQKPVNMGPTINTRGNEGGPTLSADGLEIIYDRGCAPESCSATTLRRSTRPSLSDPWTEPESMSRSKSEHQFGSAIFPFLSEDGLSLYFSASGEFGGYDVFVSKRDSLDAPFGAKENLGEPINTPGEDRMPHIAPDGSLHYVRNERLGQARWNIVRAEAETSLHQLGDFNGSGILDATDIDLLSAVIRSGSNDLTFDLNDDDILNDADRTVWVQDLVETYFGDANLDHQVDFADFLTLSSAFGGAGDWADGDFDGNGKVEFPDFLLLSGNFGKASIDTVAVPEPATSSVLLVGVVAVLGLRQRFPIRTTQHRAA